MSRRQSSGEWHATLRENMREAVDGMRRYHDSEIAHTTHAITAFLAITGAVGAVAVALLVPNHPVHHVSAIAWGVFGIVLLLALTVALTTHVKIAGDNKSYRTLGAEYVRSARALGLYEELEPGDKSSAIKQVTTIGAGKGYRRTLAIIWSFAAVLTVVTLAFAIAAPWLSTP